MDKKEFSKIRGALGKTQGRMAELLGVSQKAIQSFEQGWRKIPTHIERQALFLLAMKKLPLKKARPCWEIQKCSGETRRNCPAWEFRAGHLCWFINGTICYGEIQESWRKKMKICQQCSVFQSMFPPFGAMPKGLVSKATQ
jgi:DNA-binding XRE family transcriptional regulator